MIKQFEFEFSDYKYLIRLMVFCFLLIIGLFIFLAYFIDILGEFLFVSLGVGVPILLFLMLKKKTKRYGSSKLDDESIELNFLSFSGRILFSSIENYQVEHFNGTTLKLKLKDGKKLKIISNNNLCNTESFETFCNELEKSIEIYKNTYPDAAVVHKKTFLEKKWMPYALAIMTIAIIGALWYATSIGKTGGTIWSSLGVVLVMWAAYFKVRNKKKP